MDVFISWSGTLSHRVAIVLKTWLRSVIQVLRPYVSSEDIDKGARWFDEISRKLDSCDVGIICLTRDNIHSDWLLFEAGALSKKLSRGKICTLLIDLAPVELTPPLSEFQATSISANDMCKLIGTLNRALAPELALSEGELNAQFNRCWPDLENNVRQAVEETRESQSNTNSVITNLLLPVIYREIDGCRVLDILEWFQGYRNNEAFYTHPEIKLVEGVLSRMCGRREAYSLLETYPKDSISRYHQAKYELSLLKFAKPSPVVTVETDILLTDGLDAGMRKLWAGLLSIWHLREDNLQEAERYFELARATNIREDSMEAYGAIQLGIVAAALGQSQIAEKYFDTARRINTSNVYLTNGYPFLSLIAYHERALVSAILGKGEAKIDVEWIKTLRGHSHVVASYAHTLRLCEPALDSLVELSRDWSRPLIKESIKQRLAQFEKRLLEKAGTLFVGG
jgi:hypothetical protein